MASAPEIIALSAPGFLQTARARGRLPEDSPSTDIGSPINLLSRGAGLHGLRARDPPPRRANLGGRRPQLLMQMHDLASFLFHFPAHPSRSS